MPNTTQYIHSIESANVTYEFADNLVRLYIELHYDSTQSVVKYVNGVFGIQFPAEYIPHLLKIVVNDEIEYQFIYRPLDNSMFLGDVGSIIAGLITAGETATLIGKVYSQNSEKILLIFNNIIDSTQFISNTYSYSISLSEDYYAFYPITADHFSYGLDALFPNNYYLFLGECTAIIGDANSKVVRVQLGGGGAADYGLAIVDKTADINTILQNKTEYLNFTRHVFFATTPLLGSAYTKFRIISKEYLLNYCNNIEDLTYEIPIYASTNDWLISSPTNVGVVNGVVELKTIAASAPATCSEGDLYYNTTSHVIFEAIDTNTWKQTGTTPETGKIYVDITTNDIYRWGGSDLIKISNPTVPVLDVLVDGSSVVNSSGIAAISIAGKANKSEMSITPGTNTNADKTTIQLKEGTSATVLTAHQDISGKQDVISNTVNVTTDNSDTTTRASFNSTTKQFTFYNLKGAAGTNGDNASTKFVTMYSYQRLINGVGETEDDEVKLTWAENTPPTSGTYVEGTLIEHCYLKSWVGTTEPTTSTPDKQAVDANLNPIPVNTSPDLLGISWAIQQILDGNVISNES